MCELCMLNNSIDGFILTICNTCGVPMVVARKHKPEFSGVEIQRIARMFPGREIRWEQRKILGHAHAHILS